MKDFAYIDSSSMKVTLARKELLNLLTTFKKPFCYDDVKNSIGMNKATFYRNIAKFEDENLLQSFEAGNKRRYFEISTKKHHHFVCTKCQKIKCLHQDLELKIDNDTIIEIVVKGICAEC